MITFYYDNEILEGVFEVRNPSSIKYNLDLIQEGVFLTLMERLEKEDFATLSVRIGIYSCVATFSIDDTLNRMYFISSNINDDNFYETLKSTNGDSDIRAMLIKNWKEAKNYKPNIPICLRKEPAPH